MNRPFFLIISELKNMSITSSDTQIMVNRNLLALCLLNFLATHDVVGVQILSKSKLEKCERNSASDSLNCTKKIVLNMAVPSGSVRPLYKTLNLWGFFNSL